MQRYGILLVVIGSLLWGTDSLFRKPLTSSLSPITIVYLEHCVLSLIMAPALLRAWPTVRSLDARVWAGLAFIAAGGSVAATSLFTYSIKFGNPSVTMVLQKTQPVFTFLLARRLLGEMQGRRLWSYLALSAFGAYLLAVPDWRSGFARPDHARSVAAALAAACLWGGSTVLGRYVVARVPVTVTTGLRFVLALPVLAILHVAQSPEARTLPDSRGAFVSILLMALIPGLAALLLYYRGLQSTRASSAAIGELAFPVTAVLANWLLLDVSLAPGQLLGGVLLVSSVTALTFREASQVTNPL